MTHIQFIADHPEFQRIALQLPDNQLGESVQLLSQLRSEFPDRNFFVLADTSYGSCCVDEVAAEHIDADIVIHFGDSCFSRTSRLPVFHSIGKLEVDPEIIRSSIDKIAKNHPDCRILLLSEAGYQEQLSLFEFGNDNVHICATNDTYFDPRVEPVKTKPQGSEYLGRSFPCARGELKEEHDVLLYIGSSEKFLVALVLDFNGLRVYHASPTVQCNDASTKVSRMLMKRYASAQKVQNADIVGILVGTLGVAQYGSIIDRLKRIIRSADKRPYVVLVGKLNVAKLANFAEIPVFVMVSCALNAIIDDREYFQAVITPYELEVALNIREWNPMLYDTSFAGLLSQSIDKETSSAEMVESAENQLLKRDGSNALTVSGLEKIMASRTWYGLDVTESQKPVALATDGRTGIASTYE